MDYFSFTEPSFLDSIWIVLLYLNSLNLVQKYEILFGVVVYTFQTNSVSDMDHEVYTGSRKMFQNWPKIFLMNFVCFMKNGCIHLCLWSTGLKIIMWNHLPVLFHEYLNNNSVKYEGETHMGILHYLNRQNLNLLWIKIGIICMDVNVKHMCLVTCNMISLFPIFSPIRDEFKIKDLNYLHCIQCNVSLFMS